MKNYLAIALCICFFSLASCEKEQNLQTEIPQSEQSTISLNGTTWSCSMDVTYSSMTVHSDIQLDFLTDSTAIYQEEFSTGGNSSLVEFNIKYVFNGTDSGVMQLSRNGQIIPPDINFSYNDGEKTLIMIEPGNLTQEEHERLDKVFHPKE